MCKDSKNVKIAIKSLNKALKSLILLEDKYPEDCDITDDIRDNISNVLDQFTDWAPKGLRL